MKPLSIVLFIFVLCLLIFGSHFFIYHSWLKFTSPVSARLRKMVAVVISLLPLLFIITSFAASRYDYWLFRFTYLVSSLWLGLAVNLFFIFLILWFLFFLSKAFSFYLPLPLAGYFFIFLSFIITIIGTFNSFYPTVRKFDLPFRSLPSSWQGKKVVYLSDLHLGYIYGPKFARSVISLINQQEPDLVLIAGDFYDGTRGQLESSTAEFKNLHARFGAYLVNGNHEKFFGLSTAQKLLADTPIKTLSNELVNLEGLDVVGLEYLGEKSQGKLLVSLNSVPGFSSSSPTILLYHEPLDIEQIKKSGVDLMLAGHTHRGQIFPFNFITDLVYRGFDYGFYQLENFSLYVTAGVGSWGPPVRTSARPEIVVFKLQAL
ncbi:MAG TPA: metallophosphoesterase [bacterium]|nr:metallophosphoesterase [bacterium]